MDSYYEGLGEYMLDRQLMAESILERLGDTEGLSWLHDEMEGEGYLPKPLSVNDFVKYAKIDDPLIQEYKDLVEIYTYLSDKSIISDIERKIEKKYMPHIKRPQ